MKIEERNSMIVGISKIRSARRLYIEEFWMKIFTILGINPIISDLDLMLSYEKGKQFLSNSNGYCMFRCLDVGQHVDLIENHNCNCLVLLSVREKGKRACSVENYVAEHLAVKYPDVQIINFFLYLDDEDKRERELEKLAKYFTDDESKIEMIKRAWPKEFVDGNVYYPFSEPGKINLFILGDMYHFLNPRMKNSTYVDILYKKLNCNIITPTDLEPSGMLQYRKAYKKLKRMLPNLEGEFEHYWRDVKKIHILDCLLFRKDQIDGVLLVSDIWCEMFKEEIPMIIKVLEELEIPYYNLVFNMDSLSTIDTVLESFAETLMERKMER